jgi:hypothetical protein
MKSETLSIVNQYVDSPDPRIRQNSCTALAAIRSKVSISRLVDLALNDEDSNVRQRAEEELSTLPEEASHHSGAAFDEALTRASTCAIAYKLIGRLRTADKIIPIKRRSILARLKLAISLRTRPDTERKWKFQHFALFPSLLGGMIGFVSVTAYIIFAFGATPDSRLANYWLISCLIVAPGIGVLSTQRSNPIGLHFDRPAGFFSEIITVMVTTAIGSLIFALVAYGIFSLRSMYTFSDMVTYGPFIGILACVYAGTLRAATMSTAGVFGANRWSKYAQIISGVTTGLLVITLSVEIAGVFYPVKGFYSELWATVLPLHVGAAAAYASIDSLAPIKRASLGKMSLVIFLVLISALFISGILAFFPAGFFAEETLAATGEKPQFKSVKDLGELDHSSKENEFEYTIDSYPTPKRFQLKRPGIVHMQVIAEKKDYTFRLYRETQGGVELLFNKYIDKHSRDLERLAKLREETGDSWEQRYRELKRQGENLRYDLKAQLSEFKYEYERARRSSNLKTREQAEENYRRKRDELERKYSLFNDEYRPLRERIRLERLVLENQADLEDYFRSNLLTLKGFERVKVDLDYSTKTAETELTPGIYQIVAIQYYSYDLFNKDYDDKSLELFLEMVKKGKTGSIENLYWGFVNAILEAPFEASQQFIVTDPWKEPQETKSSCSLILKFLPPAEKTKDSNKKAKK